MAISTLQNSGIYAIRSLICGRVYVGSTKRFNKRWSEHRRTLNLGDHHSAKLQTAWKTYGPEGFIFEVLEDVANSALLIEREQFWLDSLDAVDRGFNIMYLVDSRPRWTAESRARLSATKMGHDVPAAAREKLRKARVGKVTSEEVKGKLRAANIGRKMSPEAIAKTAAFWTGRKHTAETRAKLSATKTRMMAECSVHVRRELIEPMRLSNIGRKYPPMAAETKKKLSLAQKAYHERKKLARWHAAPIERAR